MKLSIVTGALDRPEGLQRLVASIEAHTSVEWEMVIADASQVPYEPTNDKIRVLPENPRLGCTKGYNRAFAECQGEFVIWLNDDAEVLPNYDTAAIRFMQNWPKIGLGALVYSEDDSEFHVNSAWGTIYANFGIIRRSLGDQVGWFDEELRMYGCDNSLTLRVLMAGHGVAAIPEARVLHHSIKDDARRQNQTHRSRDNQVLSNKYMPHRKQWLFTFQKHRVGDDRNVWPHGRRPGVPA